MSVESPRVSPSDLDNLWQQSNRSVAKDFLKKVVRSEMTLRQLAQALEFHRVHKHLADLTLGDVLRPSHINRHAESTQASQVAGPASLSSRRESPARRPVQKRKRRDSFQSEQLKRDIIERLQASVGAVSSTHLLMMLQKAGQKVDLLVLGRMLNQLESEDVVTNLGGRPRSWRLKPQGRRAPDPIIIRKAALDRDSQAV